MSKAAPIFFRPRLSNVWRVMAAVLGIALISGSIFIGPVTFRIVRESPGAALPWVLAISMIGNLALGAAMLRAAHTGVDHLQRPIRIGPDYLPPSALGASGAATPPVLALGDLKMLIERAPMQEADARAASRMIIAYLLRETERLNARLTSGRVTIWPPNPELEAFVRASVAAHLEDRRNALILFNETAARFPRE